VVDIEKELLANSGNHSNLVLVVLVIHALLAHSIELLKAILFAKRRKKDEEIREEARCVLNDPERDDQFKCKLDDESCRLNERLRDRLYDATNKNKIR